MALPIVPGTQVTTEVGAAKIDPSAFRRQALMRGEVLGAVGEDASKMLDMVGQKMQEITNTKHIVDADIAVKQFNQQQEELLSKNPDPSTWSSVYNANLKEFKDGLLSNPAYGPDVRNHITNMVTQSGAATDINIRTAANKKQINDLGESLNKGIFIAIQNNHLDEANKLAAVGLHSGVYTTQEHATLVAGFPKAAQKAEIENGLTSDPISVYQALTAKNDKGEPLNYKMLVGKERDSITNTARIRSGKQQNDNFGNMLVDDYDPSIGGVPEDVVNVKMNTNQITRKAGTNYLDARKKAADAESKKQMAELGKSETQTLYHVEALAANPLDWQSVNPEDHRNALLEEASTITDKVKQQRAITYINRQYNSVKKQGRTEEKPWQADILARMSEDREKNALTVPLYAEPTDNKTTVEYKALQGGLKALRELSDEDIKTKFGEKAKREDILQAEGTYFDNIRNKMREWFHDPANEKKTPQDAENYRKELEAPVVYNVAKKSLEPRSKFVIGKIYTDAKGNKARWNGESFVTP